MVGNQEKEDAQNQLLRYTKRRDRILIGAVLIYMFGPGIYDWLESSNDLDLNIERIDFSDTYSGEQRWLYNVQEEISALRDDIHEQGQRTFGWRDVRKDLAR